MTFKYYFAAGQLLRIECEWVDNESVECHDYYNIMAFVHPAEKELFEIPSSYKKVDL